jgi:hypothetical protein
MRARSLFACLVVVSSSIAGGGTVACTSGGTTIHGIFVAPESLDEITDAHFFDHPFPSDIRRDPDGSVHLSGMLNPTLNITVQGYEDLTKGLLDGFSPAAAAYFLFDADIDQSTLPQSPTDALGAQSAIQLIDIDPSSPEHGQRKLVEWYFRTSEGGLYWMPDTLAIAPAHGYPLRPKTRYALVVTRAVKSFDDGPVLPSKDLLEVLDLLPVEPHAQATHDAFAPGVKEVVAAGVTTDQIAQLTIFTTNDPTDELFRVVDAEKKNFPAPTIDPTSWTFIESTSSAYIYEGIYGPAPNYQAGVIPFKNPGDGGNWVFDSNGDPILQGTLTMHFSLVIPKESACPMPANGYPLALYAHGTGGNYQSVYLETGGFGTTLPPKCIAAMGVDQIMNGLRPGAPPLDDPNYENDVDLLFFNIVNPVAARTNGREGAIDVVQQARLFTETHAVVPAFISKSGADVKFDDSKLLFVGHSQGGVNGPLFLAADDQTRGGVLSGTGAMITVALLEKTQPAPSVAQAVRTLLGLDNSAYDDELNLFHPIINLAQTIVDATDPLHYMRYIIQEPRNGVHKSIYQTEGVNSDGTGDSYAPPHGIEIASVALGLPRELPGEIVIPQDAWGGIMDVTVPPEGLQGNLAGGLASGVLGQFPPVPGSDGHFVVFDYGPCQKQAAQFLANLAADPKGLVPPIEN